MSNQLTYQTTEIGLEVIILNNGQAYVTQSSYARFSGKSKSTISERAQSLEVVEIPENKLEHEGFGKANPYKIHTRISGIGNSSNIVLIPSEIFGMWIIKDKPELGMEVVKAGVTQFLYKLSGYELTIKQPEPTTPKTYIEALEALLASEKEKERLKVEKERLSLMNDDLESDVDTLTEVVDELFGYSSIIRIAKFNGVSETKFKWRVLKAETLRQGLEVKKVPCPRFVTKNLYPHSAWEQCYPDAALPGSTSIVLRTK